jgi:hypothetical protein
MNSFLQKNILFISILFISATPKSNPEIWFDTQYSDAINFCTENQELIKKTLSKSCLPPAKALSVAFPEMLRYSLWRDLFETTALELLYVQHGKTVADFSIGWLQMKPSFAETVESKVKNNSFLVQKYSDLFQYHSSTDNIKIRKERINRLKQFEWQLQYLNAFIDYNCTIFQSENIQYEEMLQYLSAAYNRGMDCDLNELKDFSGTKTFPYGPGKKNPFGFVEVAEYFFKNDAKQLFYNP